MVQPKRRGGLANSRSNTNIKSDNNIVVNEKSDAPGPGEYESHKVVTAFKKEMKPLR